MYLAFKNLKIRSEKGHKGQKAKSKVWMMFFEVKIQ